MSGDDQDLIEVVIACSCGQIGRDAAREIISELDLAGFEIVRKSELDDWEDMTVHDSPTGCVFCDVGLMPHEDGMHRALGKATPCRNRERAMQELVDQAQELDMGYGQSETPGT